MALPQSKIDEYYMSCALELAARGAECSPNPRVGCVLVRDGEIVGRGWHQKYGGPHAEVNAVRDAGDAARGATAYVTLEPCSHYGKTPPCADLLIERGVARCVAGMRDPNPKVDGGGFAKLEGGHCGQGRRARGRMPLDEPRLHPPHDARTPVGDAENRRLARRKNRA